MYLFKRTESFFILSDKKGLFSTIRFVSDTILFTFSTFELSFLDDPSFLEIWFGDAAGIFN
jgi:hypothetical protein